MKTPHQGSNEPTPEALTAENSASSPVLNTEPPSPDAAFLAQYHRQVEEDRQHHLSAASFD